MNAGDGREAHQVLHREDERTVYHPMDHETMLPGIDVRNEGATGGRHVVERGWRDHSHLILKRSCNMKREPEFIGRRPTAGPRRMRHSYGGHEMGALAIFDQFLAGLDELFRSLVSGRFLVFGRSRALLLPTSNHRPTSAPLLRNPLRSDFMGLSFTDEPGKKSLPIVESIGQRTQPQSLLSWRFCGREHCQLIPSMGGGITGVPACRVCLAVL